MPPAKVFDNLFFVGTNERSVWAVTTSAGIIVIDAIHDYAVEAEVVDGLRALGQDPTTTTIRYAVVSHAHADHYGGARYLQEHFGTKVIMSAMDWDLVERSPEPRPKRDIVAVDGQKLTLGDTTLALYLTPGHTLGTMSTIVPVRDNNARHVAAIWGGTAFLWLGANRSTYISREAGDRFWFETYKSSARRFREIVTAAGADVPLSNHLNFDGTRTKLPKLAANPESRTPSCLDGTGLNAS
jgi:metallo-beta-lactamase class B